MICCYATANVISADMLDKMHHSVIERYVCLTLWNTTRNITK